MYSYIKGCLISSCPAYAVIETGGIGYKILTPANMFGQLPALGKEVTLHTSFIVRELFHALYGFLTCQERDTFEALLNVSGVGPKLALSLIGHMTMSELHRALANGDVPSISRVPGVGKKTSERLIMEMRDKMASLFPKEFADFATPFSIDKGIQKINDAMSALINLGYTQAIAQKAIKKTLKETSESLELAELITYALKNI